MTSTAEVLADGEPSENHSSIYEGLAPGDISVVGVTYK
jgi:hypothetical protein